MIYHNLDVSLISQWTFVILNSVFQLFIVSSSFKRIFNLKTSFMIQNINITYIYLNKKLSLFITSRESWYKGAMKILRAS